MSRYPMAAPKGNTFYKFVHKPTGRPKKYTPDSLWDKARKYFDWVNDNPLYEQKAFGTGLIRNLPKMRAMTEIGFCLFAGIDENTFHRYKTHQDYKDFWDISITISKVIYQQKFEGASADLLNSNIIGRELGLSDKKEVTGKDGGAIQSELKIINITSNIPLAQSEENIA